MKTLLISLILISAPFAQADDKLVDQGVIRRFLNYVDKKTTPYECKDRNEMRMTTPGRGLDTPYSEQKDHIRVEFISEVSPEKAKQIFDQMACESGIPFDFVMNGCESRAHKMARILEEQGIHVGKTFITGDLKVSSAKHPNEPLLFKYHVAPIIWVKEKDGSHHQYVIDPSLFNGPVRVEAWRKRLSMNAESNVKTFNTNRFQLGPNERPVAEWLEENFGVKSYQYPQKDYLTRDLAEMDQNLNDLILTQRSLKRRGQINESASTEAMCRQRRKK